MKIRIKKVFKKNIKQLRKINLVKSKQKIFYIDLQKDNSQKMSKIGKSQMTIKLIFQKKLL